MSGKTYFLCAGDASGEQHAAALVEELRRREPDARFVGLGGDHMEKAGVELAVHQREIAIGGLVEVLGDLGRVWRAWRGIRRALLDARPDLVILVDAPDFNIPLARFAKKHGQKVLYYVSPQVWAWRTGRIGKIARRVDHMAVIFPFEVGIYAGTGLPVSFVGHPLVDRLRSIWEGRTPAAARAAAGLDPERPVVALLPGSRRNEVRDSLPLQLETAAALHAKAPEVLFALAVAPTIPRERIDDAIRDARLPASLELSVIEGRTLDVLRGASVALAVPGTVTVEIALLGTPVVVAARVHPLTAFIMRRVVRVPSFTMPNLIAERTVIPEFLQEDAEPSRVAEALLARIHGGAGEAQRRDLLEVRERLGDGGAADRAATIAVEMSGGAPAA